MMGNRHPSVAPYQTFDTADRPIAVAVGNDKQFRAFAAALGQADWGEDPRFATNPARVQNRELLCALIEDQLRRSGADHWYAELTAAGVPAGPINDVAEAFAFAERLGLHATVAMPDGGAPQVANPLTLSATPVSYRSSPPHWAAEASRTGASWP